MIVSSGPPRPEWISHWLVAPIWVNVAPCGGRAEAQEFERVSRRPAIAGEVHDDIAERRSLVEHEGVVAAVAVEHICAKTAIEHVVAGISVEIVGGIVAGAVEIPLPCSTSASTFVASV